MDIPFEMNLIGASYAVLGTYASFVLQQDDCIMNVSGERLMEEREEISTP